MLFGDGTPGNPGLLAQNRLLGQAPQLAGSAAYGNAAQAYMQNLAPTDLERMRGTAATLATSQLQAPVSNGANPIQSYGATPLWNTGASYNAPDAMQAAQVGAPQQVSGQQVGAATVSQPQGMQGAQMGAAQVNAPAQNGINLTGAYDKFINGDAGANPYLTKSLQSGVDQTNASYNQNLTNLTDTLQRQVLPGIRSNALLSGGYGGSRQGIAEGNAIGDYTKAATNANLQLGLANSANTTGAQATAFNQGQDRGLAATQGLSSQQYGVAGQNASMQQQAGLANQASTNQASSTNYGGLLSGALTNASNQQGANNATAGYAQQAALSNQGANLAQGTTNAGLTQQANSTNYNGLLGVNAGNAGLNQQANLANQQVGTDASKFNATQQQGASVGNAGLQQQNNQFNASQLGNTNALNSSNQQAGIGALGGILSGQVAAGTAQDNYALNRAGQTNALLAPYLGANGSTTNQPLYSNAGGNMLGGALAGAGLAGQFGGLLGGAYNGVQPNTVGQNYTLPYAQQPINTGALQDTSWMNFGVPAVH
ncbi:MAG: hypothetical protein V4508_02220 [Pseudomonadota bacterium]